MRIFEDLFFGGPVEECVTWLIDAVEHAALDPRIGAGIKALARLHVGGNRLLRADLAALLHLLSGAHSLTQLDVPGCALEPEGVLNLLQTMQLNPNLAMREDVTEAKRDADDRVRAAHARTSSCDGAREDEREA